LTLQSVLLDLNSLPIWVLILAELLIWAALALRLWIGAPREFRWRIPIGTAIGIGLMAAVAGIQGGSLRTMTWLAILVPASFLIGTIRRRNFVSDYVALRDKYGPESAQLASFGRLLAVRIALAALGLILLSALLVRGIEI